MSTMQAFYNQLSTTQDSYWASLARLTRLTLDQMKLYGSELIWSIWD